MKIVAWIPIEMNRETTLGDAFLPLGGKPLCYHAFETFLGMDKIDEVYAFCPESEDVQQLPVGVKNILYDNVSNKIDNKIQTMCLRFSEVVDADIYICAQANAPFIKKESVDRGLAAVINDCFDSAVSVRKIDNVLWESDQQDDYKRINVLKTQKTGQLFQETGGFYIYTKELVQKQGKHIGSTPLFAEVDAIESVAVNSQEDYEIAQSIFVKKIGRDNDRYNIHILQKMLAAMQAGRDINDYFELHAYGNCAIYGAGLLGKQLYGMLDKEKVQVKAFIDQSGKDYDGITCVKPDDITTMEDVDIIIITPGFDEENIRRQLVGVSCPIICIDELLRFNSDTLKITDTKAALRRKQIKYAISEKTWEEAFEKYVDAYEKISMLHKKSVVLATTAEMRKQLVNKSLTLPFIDLVITTRCSLKCKKCFHLIPSYTKDGHCSFDVEIEEIKRDLKKLLSSVDYIVKVNILGGEPFLYGNLDELLLELTNYEKVGYFMIISNTTIVPKDSTCKILSNPKFYVHFNDYGVSSTKEEEIKRKMEKYHIIHKIKSDEKWYDFGEVQKQNLSETQLTELYQQCGFARCKALMQGLLHTCAFQKHGQKNGLIEDTGEYLQIHEYSEVVLREKIVEFYKKKTFKACDYCNAPSINGEGTVIAAGEQE